MRPILGLLLVAALPAAAQQQIAQSDMQRAIEEFRVLTRNLGLRADSPKSARKAGSSRPKWHGRLYENFRNDALDAVPHEIRQRGSNKSLLRRNQFGFNVAGPIVIPKLFDGSRSTFFSVTYEGVRERISRSNLRTIATVPERAGDFSQTVDSAGSPLPVYDPASTRANPDYDASEPVSTDNLQYLRDPFPGNRIPVNRLDPVALRDLALYPEPNTNVGPYFRNNYFSVSPETNTANGMIVKLDHAPSDKHRFETNLSFSNGFLGVARLYPTAADINPADRDFASRRGVVSHTMTASPRTVNLLYFDASTDTTSSESDMFPVYRISGYSGMGRGSPINRTTRNNFILNNGWSSRRGQHSLRAGGQWMVNQVNVFNTQFPWANHHFGEGLTSLPGIVNTGHGFASYLLGLSDFVERSEVTSPSYFRRTVASIYARDQYEARRGLVFSVAFNLEMATPRTEKYDRQSTIDLSVINPANGRPGALIVANRNGEHRGFQPVRVRLEPSASIGWSPGGNPKAVVRLSYSRAYHQIPIGSGQFGTQGFNMYPTWLSPNAQLEPAAILRDGLPVTDRVLPDLRPDAANDTIADLVDRSDLQPRVQTFACSYEREMPGSLLVSAGAYRSDGKNLLVGGLAANPNAISPDALEHRDELNNEQFRRTLRPFPQYQGFDLNGLYPAGRYQRDAGWFKLEKRGSSGLGLSAYYEFSKQFDDYTGPYGTQDFFNRDNEWSLTPGSSPHRVTLTYTYELPFGGNKGVLAFADWRRYLVEGWSITGTTAVNSGDPLALRPQFNNTGGIIQSLRVNVVPGVDPRVADPGPDQWFNPAAFAQPADFTLGDASRTHPSLLNPGSQNHDVSLTKRFSLDAERTVELSAVGFNFINHANWSDPDTVIGPASAPNVNAGKIIGSRGGRVIQLGLRYSF